MNGAPLNVLASIALQKAIETLAPEFARRFGCDVKGRFGTSKQVGERLNGGEAADAVLVTRSLVDALTADGRLAEGTRVDLAQSRVGLAVRAGAVIPDVSTPERLKAALLGARSVAYSHPGSGGASGVHLASVLDRLGIREQIDRSAKFGHGTPTAEFVVRGEADVAIQQISELRLVEGVTITPLPKELQSVTVFSGAVVADSQKSGAASQFLEFLKSANAGDVFSVCGLEPAHG